MTTFEVVYPRLTANGWLSEPEARLLWDYGSRTSGAILEVGCYHGRASVLLASLGRPLYCVDPFAGFDSGDPSGDMIERHWRTNLAPYPNAILFRQRIEEWTPRSVGFAYLDGDHTSDGTQSQIEAAVACQPQIIAIHDVGDRGDGAEIKRVAISMLGAWEARVERLAVWRVTK